MWQECWCWWNSQHCPRWWDPVGKAGVGVPVGQKGGEAGSCAGGVPRLGLAPSSPKHWGTSWPECGQRCSDPFLCPQRGHRRPGSLWGPCQGRHSWLGLLGSSASLCFHIGDMLVHLACCKFAKRLKILLFTVLIMTFFS